MTPPWGLSTPRAPKELFQKFRQSNMGALNADSPKIYFSKVSKKVIWSRDMCFSFGFPPNFACAKL